MKKINLLAISALVAMVAVTSCTKENLEKSQAAQPKTVVLKLANPTVGTTRTDSDSGKDQSATLTTGVIVFTLNNVITRYADIAADGDAVYTEPTGTTVPKVSITAATAGIEFTNISADRVYVVGNRTSAQLTALPSQNTEGKMTTSVNISAVVSDAASLLDVTSAATMSNGTHSNVAMFGFGNIITEDSGLTYIAEAKIAPTVARLEVKEVFGQDVSFKLNGIFVNNYNTQANLDGTLASTNELKNNGHYTTNYVDTYHAEVLRDWSATTLGTPDGDATVGLSVKPAKVWGYNIIAAKSLVANDKKLPRIVLSLSEVKDAVGEDVLDGANQISQKYITVTGFNDGTNPITEFKAGYVYTITKISFRKSDLTDEPELKDRVINATVTVSVLPWGNGGEIVPEI